MSDLDLTSSIKTLYNTTRVLVSVDNTDHGNISFIDQSSSVIDPILIEKLNVNMVKKLKQDRRRFSFIKNRFWVLDT